MAEKLGVSVAAKYQAPKKCQRAWRRKTTENNGGSRNGAAWQQRQAVSMKRKRR